MFADVLLEDALLSDVAADAALAAAAVAEAAAAVAELAAADAELVADAASTNRSHFALSAFELSGKDPLEVWIVLQM